METILPKFFLIENWGPELRSMAKDFGIRNHYRCIVVIQQARRQIRKAILTVLYTQLSDDFQNSGCSACTM